MFFLSFLLGRYRVPLSRLPGILRYGVIPFVSARFLHKKKLDGKNPIRYFLSWIQYCALRGQYLERFVFRPSRPARVRLRWYCAKASRERKQA